MGASILLTLLAFEVGLRCAGYRAVYETYSKPSLFWVHDPVLGWAHEPGAQADYVGPRPWPVEFREHVEINALGLRGPDLPEPPPAGARRVLVLGDSMVAGFEVPWHATFTAILQDRLSQSLDRPVQVINAGVRGYGTDQSLLYYRDRGRRLRPDVVVFLYSAHDPKDNTTLHEMRRPFGKAAYALREDGSLELLGSPVRPYPACSEVRVTARRELERVDGAFTRAMCHLQMVLLDRSALVSFLTTLVPWQDVLRWFYYLASPHLRFDTDRANGSGSDRYSYRLTHELILQMARDVERDEAAFLLIGQGGHLVDLDTSPLEAQGIEVLNLDPIEGQAPEEIRFHHDSHYNAEGHARLAAFLAPRLRDMLVRQQSRSADS
jgi:hypothetical protein